MITSSWTGLHDKPDAVKNLGGNRFNAVRWQVGLGIALKLALDAKVNVPLAESRKGQRPVGHGIQRPGDVRKDGNVMVKALMQSL